MNTEKERAWAEMNRHSPFWVCFAVFLILACDNGLRLTNLLEQRTQLDQARLMQAQNSAALAQAQQLEARLQGFSLELLQISQTNATAKQIVQDFNIQWTPSPAASAPAPAPPAPAAGAPPK
jgi:hypothetical protein